jgi:uncharacterized metal-binding protein YceD (DUF177 family)
MTRPADPEWVRIADIRHLPTGTQDIVGDETTRRRLAGRFGLSAIDRLVATVTFDVHDATISVTGRIRAAIIQVCAISGEDFPVAIDEAVNLRFVPVRDAAAPDEEIEITADDCDEIEYAGLTFDLGEALAQTLALSIDPFAQGPDADRARAEHGLAGNAGNGAFAALAGFKAAALKVKE